MFPLKNSARKELSMKKWSVCNHSRPDQHKSNGVPIAMHSSRKVRNSPASNNQNRQTISKAIKTVFTPLTGILVQIAKFMGPTWGPSGSSWPQMGPMLAPWALLSVCALVLFWWHYYSLENPYESLIYILQGCSPGTIAILWLPRIREVTLEAMGKINQCLTTTKWEMYMIHEPWQQVDNEIPHRQFI